jgi:TonB family protein
MLLPITGAVIQRGNWNEVELFVMTEERPLIQEPRVTKREKVPQVSKEYRPEIREIERIQKIEEKITSEESIVEPERIEEKPIIKETPILEEEIIKPAKVSEDVPGLPLADKPESPQVEVHKVASGKGTFQQSLPDTGFGKAIGSDSKISSGLGSGDVEFGTATGPRFLHRELPVYPMMARRLGKEGRVILRLAIDEKGDLLNVEVTEKAGHGFTEAAVEAVKKSTFLPAKKDGKPIASRALLPIRFQLERNRW